MDSYYYELLAELGEAVRYSVARGGARAGVCVCLGPWAAPTATAPTTLTAARH